MGPSEDGKAFLKQFPRDPSEEKIRKVLSDLQANGE